MAKYEGPHFIVELGLLALEQQIMEIEKFFFCAEKMYNKTLFFVQKQYYLMINNNEYKNYLNLYIDTKKELEKCNTNLINLNKDLNNCNDKLIKQNLKKNIKELKDLIKTLTENKKEYSEKLKEIRLNYGLSKNSLEKYINVQRNKSFQGTLDVHTTQKIAFRVWKSAEDVIFGDGKRFHYKHNDLDSIESKSNESGIRFDKDTLCLKFKNLVIPVRARKNDKYLKEALKNEIALCRIKRKPFKKGYKYFIQIVFKGIPPKKDNLKLGKGSVGIDLGTSTIAAVGNKQIVFKALAPNVNKYNKRITLLQRKIERSLRTNNKECFKEDGTIKKGAKLKKTKNCEKLIKELKNEYRLRSLYIRDFHNKLANEILSLGNEFITENMNFKALQKRAKKTERSEKSSEIKQKDGTIKTIQKFKKKKRFGKSINNHSPGILIRTIETKLSYFGKQLTKVNTYKYRASQYHHDTDTYEKVKLSERYKTIESIIVQRDLYSAFLLKNKLDLETIDRLKCKEEFKKFVKLHNELMKELKTKTDLPKCMGI